MNITPHKSVLLREVIDILAPIQNGIFIDATFGAGGYTKEILSKGAAQVYGIDQDPEVEKFAIELQKEFKSKFHFIHSNFSNLSGLLKENKIPKADGVIFDLGMSSMQVDQGERGFSFNKFGNLDMRMSKEGVTAANFINTVSEIELADILYKYGEEKQSRKIARLIVERRKEQPIYDTIRLAQIVREALPHQKKGKIDPATKTFQAIRIFINDELEVLKNALNEVANILKPGGRLIVVSFHSLEDKIVKEFLRANSAPKVAVSKYKKVEVYNPYRFKIFNRKIISPTEEEVDFNVRARSARLRAAIRTDFNGDTKC
jgi:16S rRNA (cytosine1402-N4)-methyltransferase